MPSKGLAKFLKEYICKDNRHCIYQRPGTVGKYHVIQRGKRINTFTRLTHTRAGEQRKKKQKERRRNF